MQHAVLARNQVDSLFHSFSRRGQESQAEVRNLKLCGFLSDQTDQCLFSRIELDLNRLCIICADASQHKALVNDRCKQSSLNVLTNKLVDATSVLKNNLLLCSWNLGFDEDEVVNVLHQNIDFGI